MTVGPDITHLPFWLRCWRYIADKATDLHSRIIRLLYQKRSSGQEPNLVNLSNKGYLGSTAVFFRVRPGVVLKAPVTVHQDQTLQPRPSVLPNFAVEQRVLEKLGDHPRVVKYLGTQTDFPTGLLFAEATGSLQRILDEHNGRLSPVTRNKWFLQAIESVAYIHQEGVWHCDLRPDNFLVHGPEKDLKLCDFGGATSKELGLSGHQLPDAGFFDPTGDWEPSPAIDIFSLGSVLYFISTGHWPFREPGGYFDSLEEMEAYEAYVEDHFRQGEFPCLKGLRGGDLILGCWTRSFSSMAAVTTAASRCLL